MVLDEFEQEGVRVVFSYLPVWELFFSMHVLAGPQHHQMRRQWVKRMEEKNGELIKEIRQLEEYTAGWTFFIDAPVWQKHRHMELSEVVPVLQSYRLDQWNALFHTNQIPFTMAAKKQILQVIARYIEQCFRQEERALRPLLLRMLRKEAEICRKEGLWRWTDTIHTRLFVEKGRLVFRKNRDYGFEIKDIREVQATVSTFLNPHLWMYVHEGCLELVKGISLERRGDEISADVVEVYKALGDATRLSILRFLYKGVTVTTQALAERLSVSEAAVSRHLQILSRAGLVKKAKNGRFVEYTFNHEKIDFIPYVFYETML